MAAGEGRLGLLQGYGHQWGDILLWIYMPPPMCMRAVITRLSESCQKTRIKLAVVARDSDLRNGRQRQMKLCEFEASIVYTVSSRPPSLKK